MPTQFAVRCTKCKAVLKLKSRPPRDKLMRCPRCKQAFACGKVLEQESTPSASSTPVARSRDEVTDSRAEQPRKRQTRGKVGGRTRRDSTVGLTASPRRKKPKSSARARKTKSKKRRGEWSLTTVMVALMLLIGFFGWGYAAGIYAHNVERFRHINPNTGMSDDEAAMVRSTAQATGGAIMLAYAVRSMIDFVKNAITQIPNAHRVIGYTFKKAIWLPITVGVVEFLILIGCVGARRVESNWDKKISADNAPPE